MAAYLYYTVFKHYSVYYVAVAYEICHKSVFRLVVDFLRRAHLLYIALIHYNHLV